MSSSSVTENTAANGDSNSQTLLRETLENVSKDCPARLGMSPNEILTKSPTVDVFFDTIAGERLRRMPPDGSRLDGALHRASRLAFAVGSLRDSVAGFMDGADEAAMMIWGAILLQLEVRRQWKRFALLVARVTDHCSWALSTSTLLIVYSVSMVG